MAKSISETKDIPKKNKEPEIVKNQKSMEEKILKKIEENNKSEGTKEKDSKKEVPKPTPVAKSPAPQVVKAVSKPKPDISKT